MMAECEAPGASVASVAMSHGINANVVHGWRQLAREGGAQRTRPSTAPVTPPRQFVPVVVAMRRRERRRRHPHRAAARCDDDGDSLAAVGGDGVRGLDARAAAVIRVDAVWLAMEPLDMRSGTESALARVVNVFGAARPHHAYLFANRRANRLKVLVHDGIGVWLAARRLNQGRFVWPSESGCDAVDHARAVRCARARAALAAHRRGRRHHGAVAQIAHVPDAHDARCGTIMLRDRTDVSEHSSTRSSCARRCLRCRRSCFKRRR